MRYTVIIRLFSFLLPMTATSFVYGAQESSLVKFINTIKPQDVNKSQISALLNSKSTEEHSSICNEVKENHKFLDFAKERGLSTLKSLELSKLCLAYSPPKEKILPGQLEEERRRIKQAEFEKHQHEVGRLKHQPVSSAVSPMKEEKKVGTIAEEKKAVFNVPPLEKPVLKRVDLSKKASTVVAEEAELKAAQVIMAENIEALKKVAGLEEQMAGYQAELTDVARKIKIAEDDYASMTGLVQFLREDMGAPDVARQLKVFKPSEHVHDTPEAYITAAEVQLAQEDPSKFDTALKRDFPVVMKHQLGGASQNLRELREKQAIIRLELEAINGKIEKLGEHLK